MTGGVSFDTFAPQVVIDLPECPDPVVINEVRNAVIELCDRGLVWREDVDPLTLIPGEAVYDVDTPSQARVATIIDVVSENSRKIYPVDQEQLIRFDPQWRVREGDVSSYFQPDPETIRFVRVPSEKEVVYINAAFTPTRSGSVVPAYIYEQYLEVIKYGAWMRLMAMPSKTWSNPQMAMTYGKLFSAGVLSARAEATKGRVRSNTTVQPKPFA
jgi:hypothetical protein